MPPAARLTDTTVHGGMIMMGAPTVLIGGLPAARLGDMHICPQVTVLVPHVGGPILPPCAPLVLIAGLPAARIGDPALCVGPPDMIAMGEPTVIIGP